MPLVTIKLFEGRSLEQKRGMVKDVTAAITKNVGCPESAVSIDIIELKQENVAQGGKLYCDGH